MASISRPPFVRQELRTALSASPFRRVSPRRLLQRLSTTRSLATRLRLEDRRFCGRPAAKVAPAALHLIVENKRNARYFYLATDVDSTAVSMQKNSQLAIATGWVEDGTVRLKDGQKRAWAARAAGAAIREVRFGANRGQLKSAGDKSTLDLSFKGLDPQVFDRLSAAIETALGRLPV